MLEVASSNGKYTISRVIAVSDADLAASQEITLPVGAVLFAPVLDSSTMIWYICIAVPTG
jgi:hypothetical protein